MGQEAPFGRDYAYMSVEAGKFWVDFLNEVFAGSELTVVSHNTLFTKLQVEAIEKFEKATLVEHGDGLCSLIIHGDRALHTDNQQIRFDPDQRALHTFSGDNHRKITRAYIMVKRPEKEKSYRMYELADESLRY